MRCGQEIKKALGHTGPAATCTKAQICTRCGTTVKAALGHTPGPAATCTTPSTCKRCGVILQAKKDHVYAPATCTKPETCVTCGATTGRALGHDEGPAATCTKAQKCKRCGATIKAALNHNYSPATCTKPKKCTRCGATTGSALGHTWVEATCTTAKHCTRCGETERAPYGHNPGPAATCTTPQTCKRCGMTLAAKLDHLPSATATCTTASTCLRCGVTIQKALGHEKGPAATCTKAQTCLRCGKILQKATGHTPGAAATCTTPSTCTKCGYIIKAKADHVYAPATCTAPETCVNCGDKLGLALGHQPGAAATCTSDQICSRCFAVLEAKTGHSWGSTPTSYNSNANGHSAVYKCKNCTATKTDTQVAHTVGTWTDNGKGAHEGTCTVCNYKVTNLHSFDSNNKCVDCGATQQVNCEHNWVIKNNSIEHWEECSKCNVTKDGSLASHNVARWIDNGDNTHSGTCTTCNYKQTFSHSFSGNTCTKCGATQVALCDHNWLAKSDSIKHWEECSKCGITKDGSLGSHNITTWTNIGNEEHEGTCTVCNYKVTEGHNYDDNGICADCGATKQCEHSWVTKNDPTTHWEECSKCGITKDGSTGDHNVTTWTDNGKGAHSGTCTVCNYKVTKLHNYNNNNICADCGAIKQTDCEHNWVMKSDSTTHWKECSKCEITKEESIENHNVTTWTDNGKGAHEGTCTVCNYKVTKTHNYGDDNTCTDCGAIKQTECEHNWVTKNDSTKHWQECSKCGITKDGSTENHKVTTWEDNGDGAHSGLCTVCNYKVTELHSYGDDNKCTDCGATKPKGECEHDWKQKNDTQYHWEECTKCNNVRNKEEHKITTWANNGDETHSGICTVCNYKVTKTHNYGDDDKCTDCGITKPEETCEHDWKQKNDNKYHWDECTKCGSIKDKEEHTVTKWKDNGDGTHEGKCTKCNQTVSENHEEGSNSKCKDCNASMNNNNNNSSNNNVDKTNSGKELPNTGKKTVIISVIGLTTLFGTSIVGIKKYKDIV